MCAFLLTLLKTHDKKKFITTGEHSRITPCTLPEWLPIEVIKNTIDEFVVRLRKELVELYECEVLKSRGRSGSTDTRNLSLDSLVAKKRVPISRTFMAAFFPGSDKHAV